MDSGLPDIKDFVLPPIVPEVVLPVCEENKPKTPKPEVCDDAEVPEVEVLAKNQLCQIISDDLLVQSVHILLGKIEFCRDSAAFLTKSYVKEAIASRRALYLTFDGVDGNMGTKYKFYQEAQPERIKKVSPWRGMAAYMYAELLMNWTEIDGNDVFSKIFDTRFIASMKLTWRVDDDNKLYCLFYIRRKSVFPTYYDSHSELSPKCRANIPFTLNMMIKYLYPGYQNKNDLPWVDSCSRMSQSEVPVSADLDFTTFFKSVADRTKSRTDNIPPKYFLNEDKLRCSLMNYQKETLKWMIHRETRPQLNYGKLLDAIKLPLPPESADQIYYFPYFGVFTESNTINYDILKVRGGILADEMGLGKTIEVLSLISAKRKDVPVKILQDGEEEFSSGGLQKKEKTAEHWAKLDNAKKFDKSLGSTVIFTPVDDRTKHIKTKNKRVETLLKCSKCSTVCVKEKCHWKEEYEVKYGPFECPQCFGEKDPIEVKTTLIVLPESLVVQWYNEIDNICPDELNVLFYYGINKNGYLHPYEIAEYDIILTTYETLKNELDFVRDTNLFQKKLRNGEQSHKFSPSSFTHISWWRLVIDESQVVEGAARKVPMMCANMQSNSYWCITGTPLVKSVNDVYFLFKFMGVWPLSVDDFWSKYAYPDYKYRILKQPEFGYGANIVVDIASQILRRNTKASVQNEINLPGLQEHVRIVRFSAIEERQYTEEKERLKNVVKNSLSNYSDSVHLTTMNSRERVMNSLCRLKETLISCGEHANFSEKRYAVRKNLNEQILFGHETVMLRLIRQKKTQVEEYLRYTVSSLFASAGVDILEDKYHSSIQHYKKVFDCLIMADETNKHFKQVMALDTVENVEDDDSDGDDGFDLDDDGTAGDTFDKLRTEFRSNRSFKRGQLNRTVNEICSFRQKRKLKNANSEDEGDAQSTSNDVPVVEDVLEERTSAPSSSETPESSNKRSAEETQEVERESSPSKKPRIDDTEGNTAQNETTSNDPVIVDDDFQRNLETMEKNSQIIMRKLERRAMRPIRLDPTMHAHLVMNLTELTKNPEVSEKTIKMIDKFGGTEKMMKDYFVSMARYCRMETGGISLIRGEWASFMAEWRTGEKEMTDVFNYVNGIGAIYKDIKRTKTRVLLVDRVIASALTMPIIERLPFVPIYTRTRCHINLIEDRNEPGGPPSEWELVPIGAGMYQKTGKRKVPHDVNKCMGFCYKNTMEKVYESETYATSNQMLLNYIRQLKRMEDMRIDTFIEFHELIEMFFCNKTEFASLQQSAQIDGPIEAMRDIMYCDHEVMESKKTQIIQNRAFQSTKCKLCRVAIKVATLQFESGFGTFHGVNLPRTAIYSFLSLIANFERRSNSSLDSSEPLRQFREYLDRLRRTLLLLNASLNVVQEYTNRLKELDTARERIKMSQLKCASKNNRAQRFGNMSDEDIRDNAKAAFLSDSVGSFEKLKAGCQEVRYLAFLFEQEKLGILAQNPCPICGSHMEAFVVYPCGHRICEDCYKRLRECNDYRDGDNVECVSCRRKYAPKTLMIAKSRTEKSKCVIPGVTLAVKLESTIRLIQELIEQDASNKIILFTSIETSTPIWRFLTQVLVRARIPCVEATRKDFGKRIYKFESEEKSKVLVCSLSMCANGLNLTNANHIIFLDPCHLRSVVAQAIGRISRYGQTREMHVHHMLVECSIDEILKNMADRNDSEREQNGWTLGDVRQMFGLSEAE